MGSRWLKPTQAPGRRELNSLRQNRESARRPLGKSQARVGGKAQRLCARLVLPFMLVSMLTAFVSCAHTAGAQLHPVYQYIAGNGYSPALEFPEGTQCHWLPGLRFKRALCRFPNGGRMVFPDNCMPDTSVALCEPVLQGV